MSKKLYISLIFSNLVVIKNKQAKLWYDMAKIQIKSEKLTPFGGIFWVMAQLGLHIVICNQKM